MFVTSYAVSFDVLFNLSYTLGRSKMVLLSLQLFRYSVGLTMLPYCVHIRVVVLFPVIKVSELWWLPMKGKFTPMVYRYNCLEQCREMKCNSCCRESWHFFAVSSHSPWWQWPPLVVCDCFTVVRHGYLCVARSCICWWYDADPGTWLPCDAYWQRVALSTRD